ncbi:hypothetical protein DFH08DRAFT_827313 [Mycena albidolilacea]|uniref:Uncharacterized protein n=1 Tax=Mycena albidolilacea TaxID=1033008 RepID=A0AAD6YZI7_9AGAR|nr:hypothetical protein DFH08DRAFT_827313 [Mycena albidolilacea]
MLESRRPHHSSSSSTAHAPLASAPLAYSLAWLGCSPAPNPLEYRKSHKNCSRHSAALTPRLWHPTVLVFALRAPPLLHLVLGLAIVVAPSAPRSVLPAFLAATYHSGCGSGFPTVLKHLEIASGTPVTCTSSENWVPGLGIFAGFRPGLAALLLLMCHDVKDVIQQGELSFPYGSAAFACPSAVLWMVTLLTKSVNARKAR